MNAINKKIIVLSTEPWLNRLHGASILDLFKGLAELGYRVEILLPSNSDKITRDKFFSIKELKFDRYIPLFSLFSLHRLFFKLMIKEMSSIVIFDFPLLPLFLIAKALWKSKGIMLILSRPVAEKGFRAWLHSLHFRLSLMLGRPFVDMFTAISPFEAAEFCRLGKILKRKIMVMPSPLGKVFERLDFMDKDEQRRRLGLNALLGKKVLLYYGVLDEQRGILELLKLFTMSFKESDQIVLLIIGDGPAKDSIKNFIRHNKINNVFFCGPVPYLKMPEIIAACDIGLVVLPDHPWWRYQCPTKLIEFLAMGKPVIASNLPGIRYIAGNSPLVVYLKSLTVDSFKEAVKKMLTVEDGVFVNNIEMRRKIIDRFSSRSLALKLSQLIDSI